MGRWVGLLSVRFRYWWGGIFLLALPALGQSPQVGEVDRISEFLDSWLFFQGQLEAGVSPEGEDGMGGRLVWTPLQTDGVSGDLSLLRGEVQYFPGADGIRLRMRLVDSEATFFCQDSEVEESYAPLESLLNDCKEEGRWALGGTLGDLYWGLGSGRLAMRVADAHAIFSLLGSGNAETYKRFRLNALMGAKVDFISPGAEEKLQGLGSAWVPRFSLGLSGLFQTQDRHWDFRVKGQVHSDVAQWVKEGIDTPLDDLSFEGEAQVLYRFLLSHDAMGSTGIRVVYQHWGNPEFRVGAFEPEEGDSGVWYLGWVNQVVFE